MILEPLALSDAFIIIQELTYDNRGAFGRLFCKNELKPITKNFEIVQINHSFNKKIGALRGMHFQQQPKAEIKMVKCIKGSVYDVIVDIRKGSSTFLEWTGVKLSENNKKMIYIPKGFAHGFQVLEPDTQLLYLHSEYYFKNFEGALRFNDPRIGINWPLPISDISERDLSHPLLDKDFKGIKI